MSGLAGFWLGVADHLWQSTLVLAALFVLAAAMRRSPGRLLHLLWITGLLKLCVPMALLAPLARRAGDLLAGALAGPSGAAAEMPAVLVTVGAVMTPARELAAAPAANAAMTAWPLVASAAWLLGCALLIARLARDLRQSRLHGGVCIDALPAADRDRLAAALAGTRVPAGRVLVAEAGVMSGVWGLLAPRIVLPRRLLAALPAAELRAILLHEDAHRRRRDPLRALLQRLAAALLFFYPLTWLVLRHLRETAEIACDEAALAAGAGAGEQTRALARALRLGLAPAPALAAAAGRGGTLLQRRLRRLSDPGRYSMKLRHRLMLAAAVVLAVAASAMPLPGEAETAPPPIIHLDLGPAAAPAAQAIPAAHAAPAAPAAVAPVATPAAQAATAASPASAAPAAQAAPAAPRAAVKRASDADVARLQDLYAGAVTKPAVMVKQAPIFPVAALEARAGGTVALLMLVDEAGAVAEFWVVDSRSDVAVLGAEFVRACGDVARQWRFEPGLDANGRPAKSLVQIAIKFEMNGDRPADDQ